MPEKPVSGRRRLHMLSAGLRAGTGCRAPSRLGAPEPAWHQSCLQLVSLRCLPVAARKHTTHSTYLKLHKFAACESCHGHSMAKLESRAAVCRQKGLSSIGSTSSSNCHGIAERPCTCHLAADLQCLPAQVSKMLLNVAIAVGKHLLRGDRGY